MSKLTIAYLTNRKQPRIDWFFDSLHRECGGDYSEIQVVIVDLHDKSRAFSEKMQRVRSSAPQNHHRWVAPKPTPWQGEFRITSENYFDAANARNTALVYSEGDYLAFVDDLSVLQPGWLQAVRDGMNLRLVVCGTYRKVKSLTVSDGNVLSFVHHEGGVDNRVEQTGGRNPLPCDGNWLYGCSFALPAEVMLEVNGFDEALSGLSFEDVCFGLRLKLARNPMVFDQRMATLESEEDHFAADDPPFKRVNRPIEGYQDIAWWMLSYVAKNTQALGTPDLRKMRQGIAAGGEPPMHSGMFKFFDGKNLLGE